MFWMWLPFFGTWWWIITVAAFIILIIAEENNSAGGAFGVLLTYLGIITLVGEGGSILGWVGDNPWRVAISVLGYLVLGLPWAAFWWWWKQSEKFEEYSTKRRKFCINKNICTESEYSPDIKIPDEYLQEWRGSGYTYDNSNLRAFWVEHKDTLTCAMTWWPIHAGSFFFKDFLWNMWNRILNLFSQVFDSIDKKVWGGVSDDFPRNRKVVMTWHSYLKHIQE